ncbi:MAG: hypothetical protein HBSAPP02_23650 [Phycisphaerae bacterium]|nr:MAG: hypothetical protein HBSAPP02_23650 [Phycisphaerae bacterium]
MRYSDDTELRDIRLQIMHTGIMSDYQLRDGEWDERFRIETTRALADGVAVRPRGDQQVVFDKKSRSRNRRRGCSAADKSDGGGMGSEPRTCDARSGKEARSRGDVRSERDERNRSDERGVKEGRSAPRVQR